MTQKLKKQPEDFEHERQIRFLPFAIRWTVIAAIPGGFASLYLFYTAPSYYELLDERRLILLSVQPAILVNLLIYLRFLLWGMVTGIIIGFPQWLILQNGWKNVRWIVNSAVSLGILTLPILWLYERQSPMVGLTFLIFLPVAVVLFGMGQLIRINPAISIFQRLRWGLVYPLGFASWVLLAGGAQTLFEQRSGGPMVFDMPLLIFILICICGIPYGILTALEAYRLYPLVQSGGKAKIKRETPPSDFE